MVEVELGAAEGALHVVRIRCEPVELLVDPVLLWMVIQLEAGSHPIEEIRVLRRGEARNLRRLFSGRRGLGDKRGLG